MSEMFSEKLQNHLNTPPTVNLLSKAWALVEINNRSKNIWLKNKRDFYLRDTAKIFPTSICLFRTSIT